MPFSSPPKSRISVSPVQPEESGKEAAPTIRNQAVQNRAARLQQQITAHARQIGFDAIGFCEATLGPEVEQGLRQFIAHNHHGTMSWLEERIEQRANPQALWPEVKTVISLGLSYAPAGDPLATLRRPDCGNISVYARNRDYHDVFKGMLKHLAQFIVKQGGDGTGIRVFVDTAPVSERDLAEKARLGWRGKHGCLVSRQHGSWLFLGEIFTSLSLPPSESQGGGCGSCTRCLTSCPTQAFLSPGKMDARRCISYLTIEHKGTIPPDFREKMGNRIYGCDDCLAVCPWNRFARQAQTLKFHARTDYIKPDLAMLAGFDDAAFRQFFSASPIKRIGWARFIRNILIALGNSGQEKFLLHTERYHHHADPVLAETAQWATKRLKDLTRQRQNNSTEQETPPQ